MAGRFTAGTESRQDTYLLRPHLPGLSVKVRGGGALEVKVYRGSPGILEVAGRARGRMESWQKWSFPCGGQATRHGGGGGGRYIRGGASAGSRWPASRSWRAPRRWVSSLPARWNRPGPHRWRGLVVVVDLRRLGPPICSAACLRPAPRSCSPRHCRVAWMPAWRTPGPMRSGCGSSQVPRAGSRDRSPTARAAGRGTGPAPGRRSRSGNRPPSERWFPCAVCRRRLSFPPCRSRWLGAITAATPARPNMTTPRSDDRVSAGARCS